MIGTSDGQQFESRFEQFANSYHNSLSDQVAIREDVDNPDEDKAMYERRKKDIERGGDEGLQIDRDHHVPLVASAIVGSDGNMAGLAIDHRVPPHPEFEQFLAKHEDSELRHMNNLVAAGMKPQEAYHEAHDKIATPIETAAVRAHAARNGKDPDEYLDAYKQFWRDAAKIASEDTDRSRHPLAHTTLYGLDEAELGKKYAMQIKPGEIPQLEGGKVEFLFGRAAAGPGRAMPANENMIQTPEPTWPPKASFNEDFKPKSYEDAVEQQTKDKFINDRVKEYDDAVKAARKRDLVERTRRMEVKSDPNRKSTADQLREWFLGPDKP